MKRPFWMHQLVEYLLGVVLMSQGLQSSKPLVPSVAGAVIIVNAGVAKGPLAVLARVPRRLHRVVDLVVLAGVVLAAIALGDRMNDTTRWVMLAVAAAHAFIIWKSDFRAPVKRVPVSAAGGRSEEFGRLAGRATGRLYNAARNRKRS